MKDELRIPDIDTQDFQPCIALFFCFCVGSPATAHCYMAIESEQSDTIDNSTVILEYSPVHISEATTATSLSETMALNSSGLTYPSPDVSNPSNNVCNFDHELRSLSA